MNEFIHFLYFSPAPYKGKEICKSMTVNFVTVSGLKG